MSDPANTLPVPIYNNVSNSGLRYARDKVLGRGAYGTVFYGNFNNSEVAVKKMLLRDWDSNQDREFNLQTTLDHENVVKVLDQFIDNEFRYIIMELCVGDLRQEIKREYKGPAVLPSDREVLYQITDGLDYIHSKQLVHRDIKPENILISAEGKMKLSDFGLSKETNERNSFSMSGFTGTLFYMAPELFKLRTSLINNEENVRATSTVDIFSLGCVFFEFLTHGIHPFGDASKVLINIEKDDPTNINVLTHKHSIHGIRALIRRMIRYEPRYRSSLTEVKQLLHPMNFHKSPATRVLFRIVELPDEVTNGIACARFHPSEPSMLTYVLHENGSVKFLDGNNNFTEFNAMFLTINNVCIPIKALEWNVDGTQRADFTESSPTEWKDDFVIWQYNYPGSHDIMYEGIPLSAKGLDKSVIAWNPFDPDVFATYKKESDKELRIWKSINYSEFLNHSIETPSSIDGIEWISENLFACCYYQKAASDVELSGGIIEVHEFDGQKLSSSQILKQFKHSDGKVVAIAWNNESNLLASCSSDGWIKVWSVDKGELVKHLKIDPGCVSLVWCPNTELRDEKIVIKTDIPLIVCGLSNGSILIWSPLESVDTTYQILTKHSTSNINQLLLSPDKRFLASNCFEKEMVIWSTATWESIYTMKGQFFEMSWNATSSKLVTRNQKSQDFFTPNLFFHFQNTDASARIQKITENIHTHIAHIPVSNINPPPYPHSASAPHHLSFPE